MTGNQSWSVLDLDDERLGDACVDIVEKVGVTWINSRLDFYEDSIEKLFRPTGELLAEAPTRVAQMAVWRGRGRPLWAPGRERGPLGPHR